MTEFYKSIPEGIKSKLQEYADIARKRDGLDIVSIEKFKELISFFAFMDTIEGHDFWYKHHKNNTFPIWSDSQNRFINP